jgi:hypothetical protein
MCLNLDDNKLPFNHFDWFRTLVFRNMKILYQQSLLIKIFKIKWTRLMRYFFAVFPMGEIVVVVLSPRGLMREWLVRPCNMIDGFLPTDILAYVLSCYDVLKHVNKLYMPKNSYLISVYSQTNFVLETISLTYPARR